MNLLPSIITTVEKSYDAPWGGLSLSRTLIHPPLKFWKKLPTKKTMYIKRKIKIYQIKLNDCNDSCCLIN